jgi:predicted ArsR family transcriptional regulator
MHGVATRLARLDGEDSFAEVNCAVRFFCRTKQEACHRFASAAKKKALYQNGITVRSHAATGTALCRWNRTNNEVCP